MELQEQHCQKKHQGAAIFHLARVNSVARAEDRVEDLNTQLSDDPMFDEDELIYGH